MNIKKNIVPIVALAGLLFSGVALYANAQTVPSVSAGSPQTITLPTNSVTLSGSAVSAAGVISTYAWTKVSGGTATIATPTTASTLVSDLVQGSYVFRLTATDAAAMSASADVTITVNPAPITSPIVSAGAPQTIVLPMNSVTLSGSATAPTGRTIASYLWAQVSGPVTTTIASPAAASTGVSGLTSAGSYVFSLTATDSAAATGSANVTIVVSPTGTKPPMPEKSKMQLEINPQGKVNLQGTLLANTGGVLTIKIWGITFSINTTGARLLGAGSELSKFVPGDIIRVTGTMDTNAATPTINAKLVRNVNAQARHDRGEDRDDHRNSRGENHDNGSDR